MIFFNVSHFSGLTQSFSYTIVHPSIVIALRFLLEKENASLTETNQSCLVRVGLVTARYNP